MTKISTLYESQNQTNRVKYFLPHQKVPKVYHIHLQFQQVQIEKKSYGGGGIQETCSSQGNVYLFEKVSVRPNWVRGSLWRFFFQGIYCRKFLKCFSMDLLLSFLSKDFLLNRF